MEINKPASAIIFLIITLILTFLFVIPKYQESVNLQTNLVRKEAEYDNKSVYYFKIFEVLKNIKGKKDILEKINSALPSNFSFASLLYSLQKNADETGLIVKLITFTPPSPTIYEQVLPATSVKEVKNIMFVANLSGSYQGLKNFLALLEKSTRLFQINTISFASSESLQAPAQFKNQLQPRDFKLEMKTYTY